MRGQASLNGILIVLLIMSAIGAIAAYGYSKHDVTDFTTAKSLSAELGKIRTYATSNDVTATFSNSNDTTTIQISDSTGLIHTDSIPGTITFNTGTAVSSITMTVYPDGTASLPGYNADTIPLTVPGAGTITLSLNPLDLEV